MFARVVRWEDGDAASMEESAAGIREDAGKGPPPGVPATEFMLLQDTAAGKTIAVMLFETEEDYRQGNETLESMSPPGGGMGNRVSVEKYEVAARLEA
jgi:hypothetical protein